MDTTVRIDLRRVLGAIVGIALIGMIAFGGRAYAEGYPPFGPTDDQWHGVFLSNGQAYFGHFYSGPGDYATLRDVYYVLAQQLQGQDAQATGQTQLSLQQLGGEIHGPQGFMKINKSQILFVEELRRDSGLVASILQLKATPPSQRTPTPNATAAPTPVATPAPSASASPARSASPSPR